MICPIIFATPGNGDCRRGDCAWFDREKKQCAVLTLAQKPTRAIIHDMNMQIEAATVTMEMPAPKLPEEDGEVPL